MKEKIKKKKYQKPTLKSVGFKDIDFKAGMSIFWRGEDVFTTGDVCAIIP